MIESYTRGGYISNDTCGFSYEVSSNPRAEADTYKLNKEELDYATNFYTIGDWRILPYGTNDNLPLLIKNTTQENSTAPGMLEKKTMMLWGKGPYLYKETKTEEDIIKTPVDDEAIQAWLDTWDYETYLFKCCVDYHHMEGAFTKVFKNRGARIGESPKIAKLEHSIMNNCRLAFPMLATEIKPTHIIETDHSRLTLSTLTNMKVYPIFNHRDPFKVPTSMAYANQYSFGDEFYTNPPIFGSLEWLKRSTATPIIFKALSKNSINIKYHVESPQEFWDREESRIKENCEKANMEYDAQMIVDYRQEFMKQLLKVLASEENTGKVWHTRKIIEVQGNNLIEHGWKITVIDQKIKDFVTSQIAISQRADRAVSAGIGLHGAIGNISETGKSDSGSEQLYAYQNYINSGVEIPELIVCKIINQAIKINFPGTKLKMGFHQTTTKREQDVTPSKRTSNQ